MKLSFRLAALALLALPLAVGCAAGTDEAATSDANAIVAGSAPITVKNFVSHPKIVEIRQIVTAVEAELASYTHETVEVPCGGLGETNHGLYSQGNVVRRLVLEYGGEDSASTTTLTYDAAGKVRFAYTTTNDVHGNSSDRRTYFAADGTRLIEVERSGHAAEPGTFDLAKAPYVATTEPSPFGDELTDPRGRFEHMPTCD